MPVKKFLCLPALFTESFSKGFSKVLRIEPVCSWVQYSWLRTTGSSLGLSHSIAYLHKPVRVRKERQLLKLAEQVHSVQVCQGVLVLLV